MPSDHLDPKPGLTEDFAENTVKLTLPKAGQFRRAAVPTLRVVAGPDLLRYAPFVPSEELIVGRDEGCGLILEHPSVSRFHARLYCDGDQQITIEDLGSTNGTTVNSLPCTKAALRPGDQLSIGTVSLRLDLLNLDELAHLGRIQERLQTVGRDSLTGLMTRPFMQEELPLLLARCARGNVPLSVLFLDLDHFSRINNTYGHGIGDEVLTSVARLILLVVRDSDPCIRYGGEEFLIFLPGSTEASACEVAERIRQAIVEHPWGATAEGLGVSASIGAAQYNRGETSGEWIVRADRAMYNAKKTGRNRVRRAAGLD